MLKPCILFHQMMKPHHHLFIFLMWYWSIPHVLCLSRVGWRTGTRPFWQGGAALSTSCMIACMCSTWACCSGGWAGCAQRTNGVLRWLAGVGGKSVAASARNGGIVGNEVIPKRCQNDFTKCPVYYFTKQLQRCGSKPTGDQETYVVVDVDASKRFASAEHEICPSLTYSRPSLWRCHSRHMQECLSSSTRLTSRRRRMNTTEMWRLQGFPIEEITPLAIARMMVQPAGNSMRVPISSPTSLITCCHACLNSISRGTDRDGWAASQHGHCGNSTCTGQARRKRMNQAQFL